MTGALLAYLRIASAVVAIQHVLAQQCYYPNGSKAPDTEKPCSSAEGSACCPDKWECLDNGLCHYPPDKLYGRYSCTDQSWKASGCPSNMCTYDMSAFGGESITQCSDHNNQWCCNADAVHVNCCKESPQPRPFFNLQDGKAYATVGSSTGSDAPNLASITGLAASSGSSKPSSTPAPSSDSPSSSSSPASASKSSDSSSSDSSPSATPTPVTSVQTSVSSGSAGVSTIVRTTVTTLSGTLPPVASFTFNPSSTTSTPDHKSKTPVIVGCAVGIPLGLAFIGVLAWLLRKRRQQKRYSATPDPYSNGSLTPEFAGGAKLQKNGATHYQLTNPGVAELSGQGVGPGRPVSTVAGKAELESGGRYAPGTAPQAPHLVGVGGGNGYGHTPQSSWGSAPPRYSPGMNQNTWAPGHAQTGSVGSVQDGVPPGAGGLASQTEGGRYVPYRPPQATAQQGGLQNVPEMAELSAVRTPPAVAELGPGRSPPA